MATAASTRDDSGAPVGIGADRKLAAVAAATLGLVIVSAAGFAPGSRARSGRR